MSGRRVVITGMGVVSPVGNDLASNWKSLTEGQSGIDLVTLMDVSAYPSRIGGEVKNFDPDRVVPKAEQKRYDRFILLALAAGDEAWADAGLVGHTLPQERFGCIFGVGVGGLTTLEANHAELLRAGPRKISPFLIPAMITNLAPGNLAIRLGLKGVNFTVTSACTSATHALGEAWRMIQLGVQDVIVTGGSEAPITGLGMGGFGRMRALTTRNEEPQRASRPFDRDRDGFVIAEGGAVLVLEELEHAKRRKAKIYAEVVGYGASCDAFHITAPPENGEGAVACMTEALRTSGLRPDQIQYINAHGTSTPVNDPAETQAIKQVFGEHAKKGLVVSSTKSMTGHLLGAAGAIESIVCAMTLHTSTVAPTINLENPDEGCDLDYCANTAREMSVEAVMSNSFGFGGTNASIVLKRFSG